MRNKKIKEIYNLLYGEYGPQGWWPIKGKYFPEKEDPFEITIGAILAQNTIWKNAQRAIMRLHDADLMNPEKILKLPEEKLAEIIKPSGYYNQKADRIKTITRHYMNWQKQNRIPGRNELLSIKGIGPETADSILLYAYHQPVFVIDIYTKRLFSRTGIANENIKYEELQNMIQSELLKDHLNDEKVFREYHSLIVEHAKRHCRKKPECGGCVLKIKGICMYKSTNKMEGET